MNSNLVSSHFYPLFSLCSTIGMLFIWGIPSTVVTPESPICSFANGYLLALYVCIVNVLA